MVDLPPDVAAVLGAVFGHRGFRAGQDQAVAAVLASKDALVVLPTGGGKSLCYQVPAVVLARRRQGTTVVVSPLIALMDDQVAALRGRGVAAAAIHSHQDDAARLAVLTALGRGELELVYVSPERAALDSFKRTLGRIAVALIAIDEAHCVAQWGHDFRPEYLRLHELREVVSCPMIALTATATPPVVAEIVRALELVPPVTVRGDFARPNLAFAVQHHAGDRTRLAATVAACEAAGLRGAHGGRAIVYCSTRKKAELVADALKRAGFAAGYYHAGRTALARERAQRSFAGGRTRILVATSAFGMGIDYGDVRLVVHFQAPGSVEAYYQEAGRAGRDGDPSRCLLLFGPADLMTQRRIQGTGGSAAMKARHEAALAAVAAYARSGACRQTILCAHFAPDDAHPPCGRCDRCGGDATDEPVEEAPPAEALHGEARATIVAAAGALRRPVGARTLAMALRGSRAKPVATAGLFDLPQYGGLADVDEDAIVATIDALVRERVLVRKGRTYPTIAVAATAAPRPSRAPTVGQLSLGAAAVAAPALGATAPRAARPRTASHTRPGRPSSPLARELDRYRKRQARALSWKAYMVFQERVIKALDEQRPQSHAALARIPGLGPAKIERFGDDLLELVRRHP
ncbi:MAG: ATP-dependent DNA helicase RecQ [Kofleriaceae bacterium]